MVNIHAQGKNPAMACILNPLEQHVLIRERLDDLNGTIIVDSGIVSGYDVFKALALGANAVCIGRLFLTILKNEGGEGIQKKINEMTRELALLMAKTGSADISHIDPSVLIHR